MVTEQIVVKSGSDKIESKIIPKGWKMKNIVNNSILKARISPYHWYRF